MCINPEFACEMSAIRLIFGDQLSRQLSSLKGIDREQDLIVLMEVSPETEYVPHHKRKIAFLFAAMRHFATDLEEEGFKVRYFKLDDSDNRQSFLLNLKNLLKSQKYSRLILTEVGEYRLKCEIDTWQEQLGITVEEREDDRFFISVSEFEEFAKGRKQLLMEQFYHFMRNKTGYLMENSKPVGGKWNFDHENRNSYDGSEKIPKRLRFEPDQVTKSVLELVDKKFSKNMGNLDDFTEPVTRENALNFLDYFVEKLLPHFGRYQDAMVENEHLMFHSRLSHLINCGLILPEEVCRQVLSKVGKDGYSLSGIEGFIRQVIGWREYVRGVYWTEMPDYRNLNYFNSRRPLPSFFWSGNCRMNCVSQVVKSTINHAYSHHIQRLMITGNLALLMGINPIEVHEWYLAVYDDAYEWVELPNTLGMALYADGGLMATKPYCASGNYINKMSDFCKNCSFNVKKKTGDDACPFNYLYWYFLNKNKDKLQSNSRLFFPYKSLDKMDPQKIQDITKSAEKFINEHS